MSPSLYILCVEGLSVMLRRYEEVGLIHGCVIARGAPSISHLLFANDCYIFFKATEAEATNVKNLLGIYERVSGQAINHRKSNVCFSQNTTTMVRRNVCTVLHVGEVLTPGNYLGLPMQIGRKKNEAFTFLIDRISQNFRAGEGKRYLREGS
ncbi:uncharacterized protein LOC141719405 [Apium graveolens]|uniref:uncharacterized protein LOC141719405 n=1 Tax=Apium graveolens TaxID=4045 RepID=UPI003D798FFC